MERGRGGDGGEVSPVLFSAVPTPSKHSVGVACSSHRAKGLSSAKGDGGGEVAIYGGRRHLQLFPENVRWSAVEGRPRPASAAVERLSSFPPCLLPSTLIKPDP